MILSDNRPAVIDGVTVTFSSINNGAVGTATVTAKGARAGMIPVLTFRTALTDGVYLVQPPWVSAADTISIALRNETGGASSPSFVVDGCCL